MGTIRGGVVRTWSGVGQVCSSRGRSIATGGRDGRYLVRSAPRHLWSRAGLDSCPLTRQTLCRSMRQSLPPASPRRGPSSPPRRHLRHQTSTEAMLVYVHHILQGRGAVCKPSRDSKEQERPDPDRYVDPTARIIDSKATNPGAPGRRRLSRSGTSPRIRGRRPGARRRTEHRDVGGNDHGPALSDGQLPARVRRAGRRR